MRVSVRVRSRPHCVSSRSATQLVASREKTPLMRRRYGGRRWRTSLREPTATPQPVASRARSSAGRADSGVAPSASTNTILSPRAAAAPARRAAPLPPLPSARRRRSRPCSQLEHRCLTTPEVSSVLPSSTTISSQGRCSACRYARDASRTGGSRSASLKAGMTTVRLGGGVAMIIMPCQRERESSAAWAAVGVGAARRPNQTCGGENENNCRNSSTSTVAPEHQRAAASVLRSTGLTFLRYGYARRTQSRWLGSTTSGSTPSSVPSEAGASSAASPGTGPTHGGHAIEAPKRSPA